LGEKLVRRKHRRETRNVRVLVFSEKLVVAGGLEENAQKTGKPDGTAGGTDQNDEVDCQEGNFHRERKQVVWGSRGWRVGEGRRTTWGISCPDESVRERKNEGTPNLEKNEKYAKFEDPSKRPHLGVRNFVATNNPRPEEKTSCQPGWL